MCVLLLLFSSDVNNNVCDTTVMEFLVFDHIYVRITRGILMLDKYRVVDIYDLESSRIK